MHSVQLSGPRGAEWIAVVPSTRRERRLGLLGRPRLASGEALLLLGCRSVHTVGMRVPITVAFLNNHFVVLQVMRVPAGRVLAPRRGGRHILECAIGADVRVGDTLKSTGGR